MSSESQRLLQHWKTIERYPEFKWIRALYNKKPSVEIFLVGGAIRDVILKKHSITDYDFVVRNISSKELEIFLSQLGTVNLVGKTFGVFKFTTNGMKLDEAVDIALPRTEIADNRSGAHRDVVISSDPTLTIEADLSRRDFTINAMAWDISTHELTDPFNGVTDIKKQILNTVGIPERRFSEDLARILRAVRFSTTLSFTINHRVIRAIKKLAPSLDKKLEQEYLVPREVIAKEIIKTFVGNPVLAFDTYDALGLTSILLPELLPMKKCPQPKRFHTEGDVWQHTRLALTKIGDAKFKKIFPEEPVTPLLVFATLFHDIGKPSTLQTPKKDGVDRIRSNNHDNVGGTMAKAICKRLKLSSYGKANIDCESLSWLVKKHLLLVHGPIEKIKNGTLEKYFFNDAVPGNILCHLFYTDGAATIPKDGNNLIALRTLLKRLKKIEPLIRTAQNKKKKALVSGDELMNTLSIKQGPRIGKILAELREAELSGTITTKKQALLLAKKLIKK